jgi:hypothetical protein
MFENMGELRLVSDCLPQSSASLILGINRCLLAV